MKNSFSRRPALLCLVSLLGLVFLAYAGVYRNEFLFDDEFLIVKNRILPGGWDEFLALFTLSSTGGFGSTDSFYRPMQTLAYFLVFKIFGLSTAGFHLLNVSLHAVNAGLVFALGRRLRLALFPSFVGAALWALHPLHTEAVTYMSATADPLHTFFLLLSAIVLVPSFTTGRMLMASAIFALGLLSKEAAIVFPAMVVACLFYFSCRGELETGPWSPRTYLGTWPLWTVALLYLVARKTVLNFDNSFQFYSQPNIYTENVIYRFYTFLATLPEYARLLVWPEGLHMERQFPVFVGFWHLPVILGAVMLFLALLLVVRFRSWGGGVVALAILWFAAAHVPHTGVLIPVNSFFLEHWMYLPSIGLFLAIGVGLSRMLEAPSLRIRIGVLGGAAAAIFALSVVTFVQNQTWSDPITFYTHILRHNPAGTARVQNNLAMAYSDKGEHSKAIDHYQMAIEISDTYPQTRHNLALALAREGRLQEAIGNWKRAIEIDPAFYFSHAMLVQAYSALGDVESAKRWQNLFEVARRERDPLARAPGSGN